MLNYRSSFSLILFEAEALLYSGVKFVSMLKTYQLNQQIYMQETVFCNSHFCCICHLHYIFACICQNGRFICLLKRESQWWCLWHLATSLPQTHRLLVIHLRIKLLFHSFPFSMSLPHFILDHKQRGSGLSSAKLEPPFSGDLRGLNHFHFECVLLASNEQLFTHLNQLPHRLFNFFLIELVFYILDQRS